MEGGNKMKITKKELEFLRTLDAHNEEGDQVKTFEKAKDRATWGNGDSRDWANFKMEIEAALSNTKIELSSEGGKIKVAALKKLIAKI
jgi:hypothetical protein